MANRDASNAPGLEPDLEECTDPGPVESPDSRTLEAREQAVEQVRLDDLYKHLDALREQAARRLAELRLRPTAGTPAAITEREAFARQFSARVANLEAVEERLVFGRLDLAGGERRYIGRIGLSDEQHNQLLVDWRAPAAEPFYQATAATPLGVIRRRSVNTSGRRVIGVQDEVLDLAAFEAHGAGGTRVVVGDGALFAGLDIARSGRMRDIVATIQADQDRAIRAPLAGVLVVQGGPGTGKTAVALHRAAFLLYANRNRIERSGVLVVGPNRLFLRYIEQVLPALGEAEAVLMRTPGELFPGVVADGRDAVTTAEVKGDVRMAAVIREAVRRRQRVPSQPRELMVEHSVVRLRPGDVRAARDRARRFGQPHNVARTGFVREIMRGLVRQLADIRDVEIDDDARATLLGELHDSVDVRREINWCWAPIGPERLLRDLFARPDLLAEAGRALSRSEQAMLRRDRREPWTLADWPCWTRPPTCWARTTRRARSRARPPRMSTPTGGPRPATPRRFRRLSAAPLSSRRATWRLATPPPIVGPRCPSGPRPIATGRSGTSSSTRPRSCPR